MVARLTSTGRRELVEEAGVEAGSGGGSDEDVAGVAAVLHLRAHVVAASHHGGVGRLLRLPARLGTCRWGRGVSHVGGPGGTRGEGVCLRMTLMLGSQGGGQLEDDLDVGVTGRGSA